MTSILHCADIHFGVEDRDALAKLDAVIERLSPDVTVVSGDVTQTGSEDEFKAAARWIASLKGPKIITPGNHDTPLYGLIDRIRRPFHRYRTYINHLDARRYEDENVVILSMNTARGIQFKLDWSVGAVDLEELDQRIETFQATDPEKVRFLNVHHPFIYPPEAPLQKTTQNGPEGLKRLSNGGCDVVLSGHIHVPFVIERQPGPKDLLSVSAGTLSTRRRNNHPAFNHIMVDEDDITITMIEFDGDGYIDSHRFTTSRQRLKAPRRAQDQTVRKRADVVATQPLRDAD